MEFNCRYYVYDKKKRELVNAAYVDNSYKWAGGGFVSTVVDLCQFGDAMLYSYQAAPVPQHTGSATPTGDTVVSKAGFLHPETVAMMWTPAAGTQGSWYKDGAYGMGWGVVPAAAHPGSTRQQRMYVTHTGGAVGASSVLLILPRLDASIPGSISLPRSSTSSTPVATDLPQGVSVAVIVNQQSVDLHKTALKIAKHFDSVDFKLL